MASSSASADLRSVVNARLRTSTTAATFGTSVLARLARSSIVTSMAGGRLSATNQSRSSSDLAAVDRPAPDIPVMMTISGSPWCWVTAIPPSVLAASAGGVRGLSVAPPQRARDRIGEQRAESVHLGDLLGAGLPEPADRA